MKFRRLTLQTLLSLSCNMAIACNDAFDTQTYPSPDGDAAATLISRFCPADDESNKTYFVTVKHHGESKTIFQTWDDPPEVAWRSEKELVITINAVDTVAISDHSFEGVTILYRAELPSEYLRAVDGAKQTIKKLAAQTDGKSFDPNSLSAVLMIDHFLSFKTWADANAEYENFR